MKLQCLWPAGALLGEAPVWHPDDSRLYWLDIKGHKLLSCDGQGGQQKVVTLPCLAASLVPRRRGGFVVGARGQVAACDPSSGVLTDLVALENALPRNRFNDGKADAAGRLWLGSMHDPEAEASGALYRVNPDGSWARVDEGYVVTNGPSISPDGCTLYHTDSPSRTIYAFDLASDGTLSRKRTFTRLREDEGYPDGMTCDAQGRLWVAHWGGGRVTCRDKSGAVLETIPLPTPFVTSCCFGGDGYGTLFIATAAIGLAPEERKRDGLAGGLFAAIPGAIGLPPAFFGG